MAEKTNDINRTEPDAITTKRGEDYVVTTYEYTEIETGAETTRGDTENLKAQIEQTRSQMGETIDALQERLSFSNLSEQVSEHVSSAIQTAKDTVYDATIGKAVGLMKNMGNGISDSSIVKTARRNPLPFVLIGLGAGLLAYNSIWGKKRTRSFSTGYRPEDYDRPSTLENVQYDSANLNQQNAEGLTNKVSTAANSAYDSVSQAVDTAYSGARDIANRAYTKAGEYGTVAYDTYDHYLEENPLAVGAAAFAFGAVVGLAIPSTRYEGELMGSARDELFRKAQDTGSTLLDKTKRIVDEAATKVSHETQPIIH